MQLSTFAQPDYWEKAELKYQKDYRQRIVDNMNMKPGKTGAVAGNVNATQNLEDIFKRNRVQPVVRTAEQKNADAARVAEARQKAIDDRKWKEKNAQKRVPYEERFIAAGFCKNDQERIDISNTMHWVEIPERLAVFQNFYYKLLVNKTAFEQQKNAADFSTLILLVENYFPTWETALQDLQYLEVRFPENKASIDTARLYCYSYYFGAAYPFENADAKDYFMNYTNTEYKPEIHQEFLQLAEKYPSAAGQLAKFMKSGSNPFYNKLAEINGKGNNLMGMKSAEARKYMWLNILSLPPYEGVGGAYKTWGSSVRTNDINTQYLLSLTTEDWVEVAMAQQGSPMNVVNKVYMNGNQLNVKPNFREGGYSFTNVFAWDETDFRWAKYVQKVIERIAATGDPEALNSLGICVAMGFATKDKNQIQCIGLFEESVKQGSIWAQFNLVFAGGFNLKGYTEQHRQKALGGFANFIETADTSSLAKAVDIVYSMGGRKYITEVKKYEWKWYEAMPSSLIKQLLTTAASKGNMRAKKYLDSGVPL